MRTIIGILAAVLAAPAIGAAPPEPGSTGLYRDATRATESGDAGRAFALFERACLAEDAMACEHLAGLDIPPMLRAKGNQAEAARTDYAARAGRAYGSRCAAAPTGDEKTCYVFLRHLLMLERWNRDHPSWPIAGVADWKREGLRALAERCRAGLDTPGHCNVVADELAPTDAVRANAVRAGVGARARAGCVTGDLRSCQLGLRTLGPATMAGWTAGARQGCDAGWGGVCLMLAEVLWRTPADRPAALQAMGRACTLPPRGSVDVRTQACAAERTARGGAPAAR